MQFRYFFIGKRFRCLFKGEVNNNCRIPLAGVMQISAFFRRFLHDPLDNGSFVGYICLVPAVCVSSSARFSGHDDGSARQRIPRGDTFPNRRRPFSFREPIFPDSVFPIRSSGRAPHLPKFSPLQGCFRIHGSQALNFASFEVGREASVLHARIPIAAPDAFSEVSRNSPAVFRGTFRVHVPA